MTKEKIKQAINAKLDQIADRLKDNKDVIIKKTKDDIKIQAIDYKRIV